MKYIIALIAFMVFVVGVIFYVSISSNEHSVPPPQTIGNAIHTVIFHGVSSDPTVKGFSLSPDYLRDIFRMIQIDGKRTLFASEAAQHVINREVPEPNLVCLTFDDGEKGLLEFVDPLLKEFGFKATAFVFTVGTENGERHHNWRELQQLKATGRWEIQTHSHTHDHLPQMTDDEVEQDLTTSLTLLKEHGFSEYPVLAYPFSEYDDRVANIAKRIGFHAAFTAGPNPRAFWDSSPFAVPRTTISQFMGQEFVCKKLGLNKEKIIGRLEILDIAKTPSPGANGQRAPKAAIIDRGDDLSHGQLGQEYLIPEMVIGPTPIFIDETATYELSLWAPKTDHDYEIEFEFIVSHPNGKNNKTIHIQNPKINGWNVLLRQELNAGENLLYFIKIAPGAVFDAIKIERIDSK
ncbi:MAG: polysaccharide deacetylase family protein [Candidatus Hinthialibacter antarcticus]|nr:polysaccharide deacetylase family protein [Candidatus Hinthialibacter antarcticus]